MDKWLSFIALAVSVAGLIYQASRNRSTDQQTVITDLRASIKEQGEAITANSMRLVAVETRLSVFLSMVERNAAGVLHHPVTPRRDYLIDRYLDGELKPEELQEFVHVLQEAATDADKTAGERMAATMMLAALSAKRAVSG
jgi:hypothetical protein